MSTAAEDRERFASAKVWRSSPDNYSSLRCLWLEADGTGQVLYGYGQTIYIAVPHTWDVPEVGRLRFTYSAPSQGVLAKEFVLHDDNRVKNLGYLLHAAQVTGAEDVTGFAYEFDCTLELTDSPWPDGLDFPYSTPRVFYGRIKKNDVSAE